MPDPFIQAPDATLQLLEAQLEDAERTEAQARHELATLTTQGDYDRVMASLEQAQERRRKILALMDGVSLEAPRRAAPDPKA